ncbi:cytochrome P450 [Coprinellus micaceus]|uniref:Cytochrome P450 n=1 Tax=Coprinellus micaceus TaxID=71717 RepID=A0A4Y7THQ5_COPMI|nr:cytochrome P450 [Coprinellus micaceus]
MVEMVSWLTRGALEILSENALGYTFDPITEDHKEHPYVTAVKGLGPLARKPSISFARMVILPLMEKVKFIPRKFFRLAGDILPWEAMHDICAIVDVMTKTSHDVLIQTKRKVALEGKGGPEDTKVKDLISILIRENAKASEEDRLPDNEVPGQISTFVFAGMDTTSNALCRVFWILANDQLAQGRLRAEIREAKVRWNAEPSYDQLASLPYLDAVCRETMRLYAPATAVTREGVPYDAILPFSKPIKTADGKETCVPKGSFIMVPIGACNTTKDLWGPDAHEWKPDRWLSPVPDAVAAARIPGVYSHLMTFIGGGRPCIGFKFSEMEMKVIIFVLLDLFHFAPSKKEIYWNNLGIVVPSTSRETLHPEMPLVVSRVL